MKMDQNTHIYRCGNLTINPQTGEVKNQTDEIRLSPVNMLVLTSLLDYQGRVITRAELFDRVWKNQIISDDTLTRCISDLRSQLSKFTDIKLLIETLPKRGYRWVPEVCKELPDSAATSQPIINLGQNKWKSRLIWGLVGLALLMMLSTSVLWIASNFVPIQKIQVALIPIKTTQQTIADEIEDILRSQLLLNKKLSFLSSSAIDSRPKNPFPYLSREFGTQWLIEGTIREINGQVKITLSLVDARTALVSYTLSQDIETGMPSLKKFCEQFIQEMKIILRVDTETD